MGILNMIGLSYASEQKEYVQEFAKELRNLNIEYFLDLEHPEEFWGQSFVDVLPKLYSNFKHVVIFASKEYMDKAYTTLELRMSTYNSAHNLDGIPSTFIILLDEDVKLPTFYRGIQCQKISERTIPEIAKLLKKILDGDTLFNNTLTFVQLYNQLAKMLDSLKDKFNLKLTEHNKGKEFRLFDNEGLEKLRFVIEENDMIYIFNNKEIYSAVMYLANTGLKFLNIGLFADCANINSIDKLELQLQELLGEL